MSLEDPHRLLASLAVHLLLLAVLFVLGNLSRILGGALKKKPMYIGMYVSGFLTVTAQILALLDRRFTRTALWMDLMAVLLAVAAALYYWNWLFKDLARR